MIARGSICETQSHLSIACELGYIDTEKFREIDERYELLLRKINSFIAHLRDRDKPD